MTNKEDAPEHIEKYKGLKKKAKKIIDTAKLAHSEAYIVAADSLLRDEEGKIDYDILEKVKIQQQFVNQMVGHYIQRANEYFGTQINPEDRMQVDQLLKAYAGVTKTELEKNLRTYGKKYTVETHEKVRDELIKKVAEQLSESAGAHLREEHIGDFVEHMGIEDIVDSTKMKVEDIKLLHGAYEAHGALSPKLIESTYLELGAPKPVYLRKKPEKKEKKKEA